LRGQRDRGIENLVKKFLAFLLNPSARYSLGILVVVGILLGAGGLTVFDFAMHETSTDKFCLSCHELEVNIGREYVGMSHSLNARGFQVTCSDCHLPKPFVPKMKRKLRAVAEIYHHILGTIDTPEKFEAHRMTMATRVWAEMNETDSRECRDCHKADQWDLEAQTQEVRDFHVGALSKDKTCIDCHKGVAHKLPEGIEPDEKHQGMDPMKAAAAR
jgi:cytochrome c-type protein NapC